MKTIFSILLQFTFLFCYSQKDSGIGLLYSDLKTTIYLYNDEINSKPVDSIKFANLENGQIKFQSNIQINPVQKSIGSTIQEGQELISHGLGPCPASLNFRVLKENPKYFYVVVDEVNWKAFYIKRNSNSNFETWQNYISRAVFFEKKNLTLYKEPNRKLIYETSSNNFTPLNAIEFKDDWIKVKRAKGIISSSSDGTLPEGWTKWRENGKILLNITLYTLE